MDYNSQKFNGTSLSDIAPNNYQQQIINNHNNYNTPSLNNSSNNNSNNSSNNNKYNDSNNNNNYDNIITENFTNDLYNNEEHIRDITKEILNGLTENNISLHDNDSEYISSNRNKKERFQEIEQVFNEKTEYTKNFLGDVFQSPKIKDMVVIFVLFFLMSQEMIKDVFAQYFTSINPDNNGVVGAKGVVIYGIILAVLFVIFRNLF